MWEKGENAGYQNFLLFPQCFQKGSSMKAFVDDNIRFTEKFIFYLERVENIVGKGENAGNQHFLIFPQCFQKASFSGLLKASTVCIRICIQQY